MKKLIQLLLIGMLVMTGVTVQVQAQTVFTIGGSYWRGNSEFESPLYQTQFDKSSHLVGPYLNMRNGKWTLGGSIFWAGWDLADETEQDMQNGMNEIAEDARRQNPGYDVEFDGTISAEHTVKRTDMNLSLGYSVTRNLSLFAAYKNLKFVEDFDLLIQGDWRISGTGSGSTDEATSPVDIHETDSGQEQNGSFIGGGATLMLPLTGSPFFLFGSANYMTALTEDWKNLVGYNFGVGYYDKSGVTFMVGYRADIFMDDDEDVMDVGDKAKVSGIMGTIAFTIK